MSPQRLLESPALPSPPGLGFSLRDHRRKLAFWYISVLFENSIIPLSLYFSLRYGTSLNLQIVCTIVTLAWGFALYIEYLLRIWRLFRHWTKNRPLDSSYDSPPGTQEDDMEGSGNGNILRLSNVPTRAEFLPQAASCPWPPPGTSAPKRIFQDASQWIFSLTLTATLIELSVAPIPKDPMFRVLAMVNPTLFFGICLPALTLDVASLLHLRAPFRISSIARGEPIRPGLYTLLEDAVAVDLNQGRAFRARLNRRWHSSPVFQRLSRRLSLFWSIAGLVIATACTVIIFTIHVDPHSHVSVDIAFAVGWGLPYIWMNVWLALTWWMVSKGLEDEKKDWLAGS